MTIGQVTIVPTIAINTNWGATGAKVTMRIRNPWMSLSFHHNETQVLALMSSKPIADPSAALAGFWNSERRHAEKFSPI
jgi:hypothetical protein